MLEFFYKDNALVIASGNKKEIVFDIEDEKIFLDSFLVDMPWEFEKSEILLEVKQWKEKLFYKFNIDNKVVVILLDDNFEAEEEILSFFGDVDILILPWSKASVKIYENIEAKLVLPYNEGKDIFLQALSQHQEAVKEYKLKWELSWERTEFINLEK